MSYQTIPNLFWVNLHTFFGSGQPCPSDTVIIELTQSSRAELGLSLAKLFTLMFTLITLTNHQKHQPQKRKAGKVTRGSFPKAGHVNNDTKLPGWAQGGERCTLGGGLKNQKLEISIGSRCFPILIYLNKHHVNFLYPRWLVSACFGVRFQAKIYKGQILPHAFSIFTP